MKNSKQMPFKKEIWKLRKSYDIHKYKLLTINFIARWMKESTPTVLRITVHEERSKGRIRMKKERTRHR